jgi:hypothetical protein
MRSQPSVISAQTERDPIDAALDELLNVEEDVVAKLRRASYALQTAQEENRRLKRELEKSDLRWYSEAQMAKKIGLSKETLARLRRKKKIPFVRFTPTLFKYSSVQEAAIAELLEQQPAVGGQLSVVRRKTG